MDRNEGKGRGWARRECSGLALEEVTNYIQT